MEEPIDFCKFFANIEANPKAIAPRLTIGQFLRAKEHLYNCDICFNRSERVLDKAENQDFPERGRN